MSLLFLSRDQQPFGNRLLCSSLYKRKCQRRKHCSWMSCGHQMFTTYSHKCTLLPPLQAVLGGIIFSLSFLMLFPSSAVPAWWSHLACTLQTLLVSLQASNVRTGAGVFCLGHPWAKPNYIPFSPLSHTYPDLMDSCLVLELPCATKPLSAGSWRSGPKFWAAKSHFHYFPLN